MIQYSRTLLRVGFLKYKSDSKFSFYVKHISLSSLHGNSCFYIQFLGMAAIFLVSAGGGRPDDGPFPR